MAALYPKDVGSCVGDIVDALKTYMHSVCGLTVNEVIKGGSLGQGTAVPGHFDLDMVVYSSDIRPAGILNDATRLEYLRKIDKMLKMCFGSKYVPEDIEADAHGICFMFDKKIEVDLLPSPHWPTPDDFYSFLDGLGSIYRRRMFSCSAAKWQKQFFERQPNEVKEYIRRAKAWRNNYWPKKGNSDGRPKSLLLGMLVIEAYERSRSGNAHSVTDLMKNDIRGHNRLRIDWSGNGATYPPHYVAKYPSAPYIIDPANPFNNLYISGIGRYEANSSEGTYEPGDGNWTVIHRLVDTLDLRQQDGTHR